MSEHTLDSLQLLKKSLIFGLASAVLCVLFSAVAALFFSLGLSVSAVNFIAWAVLICSAFLCGFLTARRIREKGLFCGLISGGVFFTSVLIVGLFVDENAQFSGIIIKLAACLATSIIGGIVGVGAKRRRRKHH